MKITYDSVSWKKFKELQQKLVGSINSLIDRITKRQDDLEDAVNKRVRFGSTITEATMSPVTTADEGRFRFTATFDNGSTGELTMAGDGLRWVHNGEIQKTLKWELSDIFRFGTEIKNIRFIATDGDPKKPGIVWFFTDGSARHVFFTDTNIVLRDYNTGKQIWSK